MSIARLLEPAAPYLLNVKRPVGWVPSDKNINVLQGSSLKARSLVDEHSGKCQMYGALLERLCHVRHAEGVGRSTERDSISISEALALILERLLRKLVEKIAFLRVEAGLESISLSTYEG